MSGWWRDICNLYDEKEGAGMRDEIMRVVGNGEEISFWADVWAGESPLRKSFG